MDNSDSKQNPDLAMFTTAELCNEILARTEAGIILVDMPPNGSDPGWCKAWRWGDRFKTIGMLEVEKARIKEVLLNEMDMMNFDDDEEEDDTDGT